MTNGLTVCFLCNEYPPLQHGGIGRGIQVLARGMVQAGHKARVLGVQESDYIGPSFEMDQGVEVYRFPGPQPDRARIRSRMLVYKKLSQWARAGEIDLIEVPDAGGWCAGWPRLPVPVLTRVHGSCSYFSVELGRPLPTLTYWLERASFARTDYWHSVSEYAAKSTQRIFNLRPVDAIIRITSVDLATLSAPDNSVEPARSRNQVVFSGTLTPKKGVVSLVRAWPAVRAACNDAQLHLFGKDLGRPRSTADLLRDLLPEPDRGTVHFHGHASQEELGAALEQAQLAVFPSYCEAFALGPIEAMARGCPTIYSLRSSGPELISHAENGWLIDPDKPEEISHAIITLLRDNNLAQRLGRAGRQHVLKFLTIERLLPEILQFYALCVRRFQHKQARIVGDGTPKAVVGGMPRAAD